MRLRAEGGLRFFAICLALGLGPACGPKFHFPSHDGDSDSDGGMSDDGTNNNTGDGPSDETPGGDGGDPVACPRPRLSLSTVYYELGDPAWPDDVATIYVLFSAGLDRKPPYECFTTGSQLYFGSGIDLWTPGGVMVTSMPDDFIAQPANLEREPIRSDSEGEEHYAFGDIFQGTELDPDPSHALAQNPVLAGIARLCNMHGECDELDFLLEPGG